jgi:dolichol-phosphate mannosyltransferase
MRTLVVLPTYNERDNVVAMIRTVRERFPQIHVLVVDDASPDGTGDLARDEASRDPGVLLLERPGKQGLGTAYIAGFAHGIAQGYDALIQMDCDFSHDPGMLEQFSELIRSHDLVIGSRYVSGGRVAEWNRFRRGLSRWANAYGRTVLGTSMRDLTGGFNAWRATALERLGFREVGSSGYAFQIEMKYRAALAGLRWVELPIAFTDRRRGVSKIPRTEVATAFLWVIRWRLAPPRADSR